MSKEKMVSDIFQAYKGQDMTITFYGLPTDNTSRLGVVSVEGNEALVIYHVGNEWDNGLTRNECPLQAAREFFAIDPKVKIERLERMKEELIEEFDHHTERRQAFDDVEGTKQVQEDLDNVSLKISRTDELIVIANAQHALSVEFNADKRTQHQQEKTQSLISWMVANSHAQSIESRLSLQKQLEKETTRLYSAKRDQRLEEENEARLPKIKATQTDAQIRLANALGLSFGPSDNLGDMINDEIAGYDALQSVFDNLVSYTNADVQTRSTKIEMVPDRCPFCSITNGQYALFTFNENGSYCFSCKESANIINTSLAIRKHAYDSVSHDDGTSQMTEEEALKAKEEKEKTQAGARGKKSVWLGSYHKYNMRIFDINNHDYQQVVNYFVNNKGLNKAFVTVHLLNYLDKHHIRYNYCNYSYKTGQRGIALNVPYVAARQRVRAIKRRLIDETLQQDAKRWNFNIYPKATHESHLWTTHDGESEVVVIVENQLDAAILNLISEMRGTIDMISFSAPLVPKNIDIALGASKYKESSTIVLAYDLDETGDHYVKRDFERLKSCNFRVMSYVWEGLETESLLDTMTRTKFSLKNLHDDILSYIG